MTLIYKLLNVEPGSRQATIMSASILGIIVNIVIASIKIAIGLAVSSMAIVSEGINNSADAASSFLTLVGTKLAGMKPTAKYPFGFGRIEYLTSLTIGCIILVAGSELMMNSFKRMQSPEEIEISTITLAIIAVSAVIKFCFGTYLVKVGEKVSSSSIVAIGNEGKDDCIASVINICCGLAFIFKGYNLDAYASFFISCMVIKGAYELLHETLAKILGESGSRALADEVYALIRKEPCIVNAADMMLHDYGPDNYSGSVNIEVDHNKSIGEVYKAIHALQLRIMHEYKITMVFGIYAVDNDNPELRLMRQRIAQFIRSHDHIISYHALYIDQSNKDIYLDMVVDYDLKDWDGLREEFTAYMAEQYPGKHLELVVETQYV